VVELAETRALLNSYEKTINEYCNRIGYMQNEIIESFQAQYGYAPQIVVRSPGRINLVGEHTDYNGGYVLPGAIDLSIWCAFGQPQPQLQSPPQTPQQGRVVANQMRLYAHNLQQGHTADAAAFTPVPNDGPSWANYVLGVVAQIQQRGHNIQGFDLAFGGNLPRGGGVSSSAALENGIGFGLNQLFDLGLTRPELITISKAAENDYVGLPCGVMDMFASMLGRPDQLLHLNCKDLTYDYVPFPSAQLSIILCNTMVKHTLIDGAFAQRVQQCNEALSILQVHHSDPPLTCLSDASLHHLTATKPNMPEVPYKRAKHILHENQRLVHMTTLLHGIDTENAQSIQRMGDLMRQSHEGLRNDYEVSCAELDFLVETATTQPNCIGARMSGGGFGGCTINVVRVGSEATFTMAMKEAYYLAFGIEMEVYHVRLGGGTQLITN
jgi:galactokinase